MSASYGGTPLLPSHPTPHRKIMANTKPDPVWVIVLAIAATLEALLTVRGGFGLNCVAASLGLLGVPILLGLFRMKEAKLRAGGRYSDWTFPARRLAVAITVVGWCLGLLNVFFIAKDLSR